MCSIPGVRHTVLDQRRYFADTRKRTRLGGDIDGFESLNLKCNHQSHPKRVGFGADGKFLIADLAEYPSCRCREISERIVRGAVARGLQLDSQLDHPAPWLGAIRFAVADLPVNAANTGWPQRPCDRIPSWLVEAFNTGKI